jgi:hypothetical protein
VIFFISGRQSLQGNLQVFEGKSDVLRILVEVFPILAGYPGNIFQGKRQVLRVLDFYFLFFIFYIFFPLLLFFDFSPSPLLFLRIFLRIWVFFSRVGGRY